MPKFRDDPQTPAWAPILAILLVATLIVLSWTGYTESDDQAYAEAATAWIGHFPYLGTNHHALRHLIVLPTALFFRVFGPSELALALPILSYFAATLALTTLAVTKIAGPRAGTIALLLTGTIPALTLGASVATTDIPETFCILSSVWAFYFGWHNQRRWLFLLSGAMAGFGFITRETSAAILVLYGILFLAQYGGSRRPYLWMATGFAIVAGLDFLALYLASGDPLYRFHISLRGVARDSPLAQDVYRTEPGVDRFGALAAPRGLKPLIIAFLNQQFGLLFWFAVPAAVLVWKRPTASRPAARLLTAAALIWFVVSFYVLSDYLNVIARYCDFAAVAVTVPLAIWLAGLRNRRLAVACLAIILTVNTLLIVSSDNHPLFGEKALVALAAATTEPISTDPGTFQGAAIPLQWAAISDRVAAALPQPGGLYYFDSHPRRGIPAGWPVQLPGPNWREVARVRKPTKPIALLANRLNVHRFLPSGIANKLDPPPRVAVLYRIPLAE